MSPLLKRFKKYFTNHASWAVYIRLNQEIECVECEHDLSSGEGDPDCLYCFGTGKHVTLEKMQVLLAKTQLFYRPDFDAPLGMLTAGDTRAYFLPESTPQSLDLVLEVSWDRPYEEVFDYGEPTEIIHIYKIESLESQADGSIIYFTGMLEIQDFRLDQITRALFSRR